LTLRPTLKRGLTYIFPDRNLLHNTGGGCESASRARALTGLHYTMYFQK
jgi:hypothetical protein